MAQVKNTAVIATPEVKSNFVISWNKEQGGIELRIAKGRHLTESEKKELMDRKGLAFNWKGHGDPKYYWYTNFSDEKLELIKNSFIGKEGVELPKLTKSEKSALDAKVAERLAKQAERRATKPSTGRKSAVANEVAELKAALAQQTETMAQMMAFMQASSQPQGRPAAKKVASATK